MIKHFLLFSVVLIFSEKVFSQPVNQPNGGILNRVELSDVPTKRVVCDYHLVSPPQSDTSFYKNGKIESISEYDAAFRRIGVYQKYDSTGVLVISGNYGQLDSGVCINCFDGLSRPENTGNWKKIDRIEIHDFMVGKWNEYFSNGKLKSSGEYDSLFTIYSGTVINESQNGPNNVYQHIQQLKKGIWMYYNEDGKLILKEEYFQGVLVFKTAYWFE